MRVSRMTEEKYHKMLALTESMQNDAKKLPNGQIKEMTSMFADVLRDVVLAHKLEEVEEAGEV